MCFACFLGTFVGQHNISLSRPAKERKWHQRGGNECKAEDEIGPRETTKALSNHICPMNGGRKSAEARTGELGQAATSKRIDGRRRKRKKNTLSVQKEHSPPPSSSLLLSLFPSSFGRILPEGKIFLLTAAATDGRGVADADGRAKKRKRSVRPFKVRFRRLARMER